MHFKMTIKEQQFLYKHGQMSVQYSQKDTFRKAKIFESEFETLELRDSQVIDCL